MRQTTHILVARLEPVPARPDSLVTPEIRNHAQNHGNRDGRDKERRMPYVEPKKLLSVRANTSRGVCR